MKLIHKPTQALAAVAALLLVSCPAIAQDATANTATVGTVTEADVAEPVDREEDDKDFPWGLLGLLGLAGLLGRKRNDDRDVRVDARRDTRP